MASTPSGCYNTSVGQGRAGVQSPAWPALLRLDTAALPPVIPPRHLSRQRGRGVRRASLIGLPNLVAHVLVLAVESANRIFTKAVDIAEHRTHNWQAEGLSHPPAHNSPEGEGPTNRRPPQI